MPRNILLTSILVICSFTARAAGDPTVIEAKALIARVVPSHAAQFACEIIPQGRLPAGLPRPGMLDPNDPCIALDLSAENTPFWPTEAFKDGPWMWCLLHNFGGNSDLSTQLSQLSKVFPETMASPNKGLLVGHALTPEGQCYPRVVHDLMPECVWRKEAVDIEPWLIGYVTHCYGANSVKANQAWDGILTTVGYIRYNSVSEAPANSILMARPLRGEKARTYGNTRSSHNKAQLPKARLALGAAAPEYAASDTFNWRLEGNRNIAKHPGRKFSSFHPLKQEDTLCFESKESGVGEHAS